MAHPADIAPKTPAAFAGGRLSPEEAERLASTFRPSWELDDAPFTGPGTLSETDLRALQGGGIHPEVRAAPQSDGHQKHAYASNGAHAAPTPTQSHEPENSVIIDRSITADVTSASPPKPAAAAKPGSTMLGMAPPQALQAAPAPAPQPVPASAPPPPPVLARPPTPGRPVAPAFNVSPPVAKPRPKPVSIDLEESYPKKSKTGLWVGLGVGGMAAMGLVVWLVASSGNSEKAAQPTPTAATKALDDKLSAVPPPPTTAAAPTPTVDPSPPATTAAAAPPPATVAAPIPTTPVMSLPQAAPPRAAAAAVRPSYAAPAAAPRPAGKPKGGQTIVRDVPF